MTAIEPTAIKPRPPLKRVEIHQLFAQFIIRDDVKEALAHTIEHKRAKLLQTAFHNEAGYDISSNWIYKVMRNLAQSTTPVQIGSTIYNVVPPRNI
jgi:hypothetical protein